MERPKQLLMFQLRYLGAEVFFLFQFHLQLMFHFCLECSMLYCMQTASSILSVETKPILDTLNALDLSVHAGPVATQLCDSGFEHQVPVSSVVKILNDAGVPHSRAIAVKVVVTRSMTSPVR
jgi:hypothetical protein